MSSSTKPINTSRFAHLLRARSVDVANRRILISRLAGSEQEADLTVPTNCAGFGRIRHFRLDTPEGWPENPLPMAPACKALGIVPMPRIMQAQVFQNAACPWRCWYCFVPNSLLNADARQAEWFTADELVALYAKEFLRPLIIDLSGGSPDLAPEWTLWMMDALAAAGLSDATYLWSDDSLSTSHLFDSLCTAELDRLVAYRNYGRVCCFKGFDDRSFAFNTRAAPADFKNQFEIMRRLLGVGIDLYGYVTLTSPYSDNIASGVKIFVDRLQELDENLPLRVIPLPIQVFTPVNGRLTPERKLSLDIQEEAVAAWTSELDNRFNMDIRSLSIADVPLTWKRKRW